MNLTVEIAGEERGLIMEQNGQIQRKMPHDADAEQAVLSSILMDRDAAAEAFEVLKAEDFYSPENKAVFEAAYQLYTKGEPIDVVTVKNQLEENGVFAEIGAWKRWLISQRLSEARLM